MAQSPVSPPGPVDSTRSNKRQATDPAEGQDTRAKRSPKLEPLSPGPTSGATKVASKKADTEWEAVVALTQLKTRDDSSDSSSDDESKTSPGQVAESTPMGDTEGEAHRDTGVPSLVGKMSPPGCQKTPARLLQLPPLLRLPLSSSTQKATSSPKDSDTVPGKAQTPDTDPALSPSPPLPPVASVSPTLPERVLTVATASPSTSSAVEESGAVAVKPSVSGATSGTPACDTCLSLSMQCQCKKQEGMPAQKPKASIKGSSSVSDLTLWPSGYPATVGNPKPAAVAAYPEPSAMTVEEKPMVASRASPENHALNKKAASFKDWVGCAKGAPAATPNALTAGPPQHRPAQGLDVSAQLALYPEIQALGRHWEALIAKMQQHLPMDERGPQSSAGLHREQFGPVVTSEEYRRLSGFLDSMVRQLKQQQGRHHRERAQKQQQQHHLGTTPRHYQGPLYFNPQQHHGQHDHHAQYQKQHYQHQQYQHQPRQCSQQQQPQSWPGQPWPGPQPLQQASHYHQSRPDTPVHGHSSAGGPNCPNNTAGLELRL